MWTYVSSSSKDYVTEKFFNILRYNVIPVTYSGANFSALAPPHSYINTLDFPSVTKLSKHLLKVRAGNDPSRCLKLYIMAEKAKGQRSLLSHLRIY